MLSQTKKISLELDTCDTNQMGVNNIPPTNNNLKLLNEVEPNLVRDFSTLKKVHSYLALD